jgi:hypothetical protein
LGGIALLKSAKNLKVRQEAEDALHKKANLITDDTMTWIFLRNN